jgi:hypothetical protein
MSYTCLSSNERLAKKPHKCIWCGERIKIGDKYQEIRGINDGNFQLNRFHLECISACNDDMDNSLDDTFSPYCFDRPKAISMESNDKAEPRR